MSNGSGANGGMPLANGLNRLGSPMPISSGVGEAASAVPLRQRSTRIAGPGLSAPPAQQLPPALLPPQDDIAPAWAVWIHGAGWLRVRTGGDVFAAEDEAVALSAARLYGGPSWRKIASVVLMDGSMIDLEPVFQAQERERLDRAIRNSLRAKIARWRARFERPKHQS